MTLEARSWLPAPALFDGVLSDRVSHIVDAWRSKWLPNPGKTPTRFQSGHTLESGRSEWRSSCGGLHSVCGRQGEARLAAAMLGIKRQAANINAADLTLMNRLSSEAIASLFEMLADVFRTKPKAEPTNQITSGNSSDIAIALRFTIAGPSGRLIDVYVTPDAAVAGRKAHLASRHHLSQLGNREEAVARQAVRVGGYVGTGEIALAELRSLAAGDVLVLDREVTKPFDPTVNGRRLRAGDLELRHDGRTFFLQSASFERRGLA